MKAVAGFLLVLCYLAASQAWSCLEAPRLYSPVQIDAGQGKVVARDRYYRVYFLSGTSWYRLGTVSLKHVTVGAAGIWGTSTTNKLYKYIAGNFTLAPSVTIQQVDAGGDNIGAVTSSSYGYCLRSSYTRAFKGVGSLSWSSMSRSSLKYISCGPYSCWGIDTSSRVYVTSRFVASSCYTASWICVSGYSMKMIEVGSDGSVFGVATNGRVYQRYGLSSSRPQGTSWSNVAMCMAINHVTYDLGKLWALTTSGLLLKCSH